MSDVAEHMIHFNGFSMRANLAERKTQTRRTLTDSKQEQLLALNGETTVREIQEGEVSPSPLRFFYAEEGHSGEGWYACLKQYPGEGAEYLGTCPYGKPGDLLWCREAFRMPKEADGEYTPKENVTTTGYDVALPGPSRYEADGKRAGEVFGRRWLPNVDWGRLRPSIHMPKALCRLWLRVEGVRVERLHAIDGDGAIAEGITPGHVKRYSTKAERASDASPDDTRWHYRNAFREIWNGTHGDDAWEENPFVWVIRYSIHSGPNQ